jgi:hypothetical protein
MNLFEYDALPASPIQIAPPRVIKVPCANPACCGGKVEHRSIGSPFVSLSICRTCGGKGYIVTEAQS